MTKTTDRRLRKHPEQEKLISSEGDQNEQIRELKELQRRLADRIRKIECAADRKQKDESP